MITTIIILGIITVFIIGFVQVYNRHSDIIKKIDFAEGYRIKFIEFANKYIQTYDNYKRTGEFDNELYIWLTMKISKIQNYVGSFGIISYKPAYKDYMINNYQVIVNTMSKFRDGQIHNFDIGTVDDCLLRYIGHLEEYSHSTFRNLRNPIVWFREGFKLILSAPISTLNLFGIISNQTVNSIKESLTYKILSGLAALVALISGFVTIIVGYKETKDFIKNLFIISGF